jgi:hypothetical protein
MQLPWLCFCTAPLGMFRQTAKKSTAFIMAVCPSVDTYHDDLHWMDSGQIWYWWFMVICRLTQNLVEMGQIHRLLAQWQFSHMTAARIRCFVFASPCPMSCTFQLSWIWRMFACCLHNYVLEWHALANHLKNLEDLKPFKKQVKPFCYNSPFIR